MTEEPRGGGDAGPAEELIRALYREQAGPLFGFVLHLVDGDRQRAEDVVQETLVRAWRHADRLEVAAGSVRPWLVTVARRIVIDGHRRSAARPPETDAGPLELLPAEDELDRALRMMAITDALGALTPAHREVIVESYLKGRGIAEVAAALGIPEGTAKSRLFYALRSLRIALAERGVTEK